MGDFYSHPVGELYWYRHVAVVDFVRSNSAIFCRKSPHLLDEPTQEWIPMEPCPTSAYVKSEKLGFGKKNYGFQKNTRFLFCQSEKPMYMFLCSTLKKVGKNFSRGL